MLATLIASAALLSASAYASAPGNAHVVNMCSYDVYLCNVPSADGGYEQTDTTLKSGQSWSQAWTQLSNGNGWSIKLSKDDSLTDILQYEYTWQNDGTIWYDLSCVNGNPWDGNWEITSSTDNCSPKQAAYRYATDDAYGMQSCPQDASITVTLCSGEAADNGTYGDSGNASPASSAAAPASTQAAPAYTPAAVAPAYTPAPDPVSVAVAPTTFATQVTEIAVAANGDIVNVVETEFVTEIVTAYAAKPRARRHEHHPHHRHE